MNHPPNASPTERYLGMDVHNHYVMVGGMNRQKEWVLRPRKVRVSSFRSWAERNLKSIDAVAYEASLFPLFTKHSTLDTAAKSNNHIRFHR